MSGGITLAETRKIIICIPEQLLQELDYIVSIEKTNRSEFVRRTIRFYIKEKKRTEARGKLINGYQEMAEINKKISEKWFEADNSLQQKYEDKLRELE